MKKEDGGPAYPQPLTDNHGSMDYPSNGWGLGGMSLRDYMASAALTGILNYFPVVSREDLDSTERQKRLAKHAYDMADAMIAERAK